MTQLASLTEEIFRSWASFFMFLMLEALLLTLGHTVLLPFVSFLIYNIPFTTCKAGLMGFKQAVSPLSDLCNPSVTCLFDALLYVKSHLNACLQVTKAEIRRLNLKLLRLKAQSLTQQDTMDFVIFSPTCPNLQYFIISWNLHCFPQQNVNIVNIHCTFL